MKTRRQNYSNITKCFYFRPVGSQIIWLIIFLIAMLFTVPSVHAQQNERNQTDISKSQKRQGAKYYMAIFFDYKEGKTSQAMNFIRANFLPVDKKVGREVIVFNPITGPWDEIAFFPLSQGPSDLEWEISPTDAKWNTVFIEQTGSQEKVAQLWREYRTLVNKTKKMLVIQPVGWQH